MISQNFVHYDDDRYPYVYGDTRRETLAMLDEIDRRVQAEQAAFYIF